MSRVPPRLPQQLAAVWLASAAATWATWELLGPSSSPPWSGVAIAVGGTIVLIWQALRNRRRWPEQRAVERALREHRDPGPEFRPAVEQSIREWLARPTSDAWAIGLIFGGLATVCVTVAVVREDASVALPAFPLLLIGLWGVAAVRRKDRRVNRWLTDPPVAAEEAER